MQQDSSQSKSVQLSASSVGKPTTANDQATRENGQSKSVTSQGSSLRSGEGVVAVIPAYNEEETIANVVAETSKYVEKVLVVDDGSSDDTIERASAVADGVIKHPTNMGVGATVYTGYCAAIREDFDVVIQIDADGQHDPSYIPEMLEVMDGGADMVIGSRWLNESYKEYSFLRRAGIRFFTFEANVLGNLDISDITSGFRAYDVSMLDDLGRPSDSHWALEQTLEAARKGYSVDEVSVPMPPDTDGSQFDVDTFLKYPPRMILITLKVILFR
jgi:glycosyltransferase involved in cell wall biosynthesis